MAMVAAVCWVLTGSGAAECPTRDTHRDCCFRVDAVFAATALQTLAGDDERKPWRTSDSCPLPDGKREPKGAPSLKSTALEVVRDLVEL
jgi:hypothetical protein